MQNKRHIVAALALGMLLPLQAQMAPVTYENVFLKHSTVSHQGPAVSYQHSAVRPQATMQGTVYSNDLFNRKAKKNTTFAYRGFSEMSAYGQISPADIGAPSATQYKAPGPPPPTPDPDAPHVLPVGDACWPLAILAALYALVIVVKSRKVLPSTPGQVER